MDFEEIRGIGPKKRALLEEIGIRKPEDMLTYFPVSYEDRSRLTPLSELTEGTPYYVSGIVTRKTSQYIPGKKGKLLRLTIQDDTGLLNVIFFQGQYYEKKLQVQQQYNFYGVVSSYQKRLTMVQPEFEPGGSVFHSAILPVYHTVRGLTQKDLRRIAQAVLNDLPDLPEVLPDSIIQKNRLCSRQDAVRNMHFPEDRNTFRQARIRMIYEELFLFQTGLFLRSHARCREAVGCVCRTDDSIRNFADRLPYPLTGAQERVLHEIEQDMQSAIPMQRLVQGDVGSGKTAVAAAALYKAACSGWQGVLMAPTELLATQHFQSFRSMFEGTGITIGLLTSSVSVSEKRKLKQDLAAGTIRILIGTHAILQDDVRFQALGLVVTDEQHRFGVAQRMKLSEKGNHPDILVMTATPIPRTLAVVLYGDLDISVIDELPPGRKPVLTRVVPESARHTVYRKVRNELQKGRQVYVVCPMIEDSDQLQLHSAEAVYQELQTWFPEYASGLVHGAMSRKEKDRVMEEFSQGRLQLLTATVVIEVGINVPNASVMVIENAERFGLAQLHQLRGRVGRGTDQAWCFLITDPHSETGRERCAVMEETTDGFEIAERDLQMRGPGDFFGTRQHGLPALKTADLAKHVGVLNALRPDVREMLQKDPALQSEEHRCVAAGVREMFGEGTNPGI